MKLNVGQEFASGRTGVRVGKEKKKKKHSFLNLLCYKPLA